MSNLKKHTTTSTLNKVSNLYIASRKREDKQIVSLFINDKNEIAKFLMQLSYYLGIKEPPNNSILKMLIEYIVDTHPSYTLQDIKLAFDMGLKNQLDVDINHYNSFDVVYISRVLNKYDEYRNKHINIIKQKEQYKKDIESGIIYGSKPSQNELNKKMALTITQLYRGYINKVNKKTNDNVLIDSKTQYPYLYDIMLKTKIIKGKSTIITPEQKTSYITSYFEYIRVNHNEEWLIDMLKEKFSI